MGRAVKGKRPQQRRPAENGVAAGAGGLQRETEALRAHLISTEAERRRFAALYDAAPVGLLSLDAQCVVADVNQTGARMLGLTREALVGTPLAVHVSRADRATFARHVAEAMSLVSRRTSCMVTFETGAAKTFDGYLESIAGRDAIGRLCCRTALLDATERRQMEKSLAERRRREAALRDEVEAAGRRFARIAAVGSLLVESLDLDETLRRAVRVPVPEFASFCAVDLADDVGRVHRAATATADPEADLPLDPYAPRGSAGVVRTGQPTVLLAPSHADILGLSTDPRQLPLLWSRVGSYLCLPLRARGRVLGAFTLARSTRDAFSSADLALAEELARHAALVIDNALLYREAQEADRRKDEFLAMLGHELRNPLAAIVMAAGRLRWNGASDPGVLRATEVVERQSGRLARLVDDLLDVSRITHGKIVLRPEDVVLHDAIARAVESARPVIDARHHELAMTMPADPIVLHGDPARLEQVFVNLLVNAARYTEPGGHISVDILRDGDAAVVRVKDTGVGIAPENLLRIFDPFTRAGADMDRGDRGLGIGLTLARGLVDLHGGSLTAHSAGVGRGSDFVVRLPLAVGSATAARRAPEASGATVAPRRLLIVEDEPDVAEMMRERLASMGHDVRVARDGVEGVALARERPPEILLVDLGLPGMSGYDVARRLRREPALAGATFVALTGYGDEAARRRSLEAGFDTHFTKPIPDEALLRLLRAP